ncbi:glycosyltransferase family 39 protein [Pseudomonas entomophila]|uniref:glycosyltransferase family 39 protein n=1 Tax=Pseudomonas entomophila TaxID=312306 RepID=UPI00200D1310|nr:glycosyltransferase family 39 protein [Pseudomonas entomophila]
MTVSRCWPDAGTRTLVVLAILLISTALRLHHVTLPVIWLDEAFSALISHLPPEQILFHTARDVHPPLYYLILHYWMQGFGDAPLALRSFSVCAGVATVGIGMLLARQLASWRAAVIAGLLLAFFPIGIRYSQEVRMYALLGLLLMTALYTLWQWVNRQNIIYLMAYCLLMVAAMYTHYLSILCVMANWLYLSLTKDTHGRLHVLSRAWWVGHLVMIIIYLPWLPMLYQQMGHRELVGWIANFPTSLMSIAQSFWRAFTLSVVSRYSDVLSLLLALFIAMASLRVLRRVVKPGQPSVLLLSYCFIPILVLWLASYGMPLYINRYLYFAFLGLPLVLAIAMDTLRKRALLLSVAACLSLELVGLAVFYDYQAKPGGDLGTVMAHVNEQWRPGDALLGDRRRSYLSIEYYNATGRPAFFYTKIQPDTSGQAAKTYGTLTLFYQRSNELYVATPQVLAKRYKRLWRVTEPSSVYTPDMPTDGWVKVDEFTEGSFKAVLYTVP